MSKVVGRDKEIEQLERALQSRKSELIAVYGRRRVGKTFLIRETFKKHFIFEVSGIPDGSFREQLSHFFHEICQRSPKFKTKTPPTNWLEAFYLLQAFIENSRSKQKKVIFIDEFPWMNTHKSKFVQMFAHFWNSFCTRRDDLVVVICGSAASFMVNQVIRDRKGLHNRISVRIRLLPFNLHETELFLKSRKVHFNRYSCLQVYMAIGGIPHYLEKILPGDSVPMAIDRLCFQQNGILVDEFDQVFASLFDNSENHTRIVEALAASQKGLTREELIARTQIPSGGTLTRAVNELTESGFISEYRPFGNRVKETLWRITDEYCVFYLKFIRKNASLSWTTLYQSRSYSSWSGFAFETLCLKHVAQILKGLEIRGMSAHASSWRNENAQVDLLIDRSDRCINLCEIKFSEREFVITKSYAEAIARKKMEFIRAMNSRKNIFVTFITTYGVKNNSYRSLVMDNQVKMDSLFQSL
ncbi:MAG: ATP-binding protein [Bacteroidia bacterium]|nr:ATP-binding protein [Bacteroidia bacterium]